MPARQLLIGASLAVAAPAAAAPVVDPLFGAGAVVERGRPIHVRGTAAPGERLPVTLARSRRSTRADSTGAWTVGLPALPAGGPHQLIVTGAGGSRAAAKGLLVGDVWLCSGQSNMEWPLRRSAGAEELASSAKDPELRI